MPVEYRKGDLFSTDAPALAHGCNCMGSMGAGIALQFKKRYPQMSEQYRRGCVLMRYQPGDVMVSQEDKLIFNLMTQPRPGASAKVKYIVSALEKAIWRAEENKLSAIAMPRIGAGLGGLDWDTEVQPAIEELGKKTLVNLIVYSL